ncbi:MAG: nucleotidyltransferase family protein [Candidatus Latescibacterota bacterium]|jgi:molybdenum cofactor cytidylyltransferase
MSEPGGAVAVVLAAGRSTRMGRLKQLLPLEGRTLIEAVVAALVGRVDRIVVVVGYGAAEVRQVLAGLPVVCAENPEYAAGMLTSVQCGLHAAGRPGPYLVCLGDQPVIPAGVVEAILRAGAAAPGSIVVPTWEDRGGHPVLLPEACLEEVLALPSDRGLDAVVRRPGARVVRLPVEDPAVLRDLDTPEDYARELARRERSSEQTGR